MGSAIEVTRCESDASTVWATVRLAKLPHLSVDVVLTLDTGDSPSLVSITVGATDGRISAENLRGVPLGRVSNAVLKHLRDKGTDWGSRAFNDDTMSGRDRMLGQIVDTLARQRVPDPSGTTREGFKWNDALLRRAAKQVLIRQGRETGSVHRLLAGWMHVQFPDGPDPESEHGRQAAKDLIGRCKDRGFLGPYDPHSRTWAPGPLLIADDDSTTDDTKGENR